MKNSEPKSCDPYVDSLIRNADAKEARVFLKILKPLPFLIVIIAVFFFWQLFPVYYPRSRKTFLKTLLYQICSHPDGFNLFSFPYWQNRQEIRRYPPRFPLKRDD